MKFMKVLSLALAILTLFAFFQNCEPPPPNEFANKSTVLGQDANALSCRASFSPAAIEPGNSQPITLSWQSFGAKSISIDCSQEIGLSDTPALNGDYSLSGIPTSGISCNFTVVNSKGEESTCEALLSLPGAPNCGVYLQKGSIKSKSITVLPGDLVSIYWSISFIKAPVLICPDSNPPVHQNITSGTKAIQTSVGNADVNCSLYEGNSGIPLCTGSARLPTATPTPTPTPPSVKVNPSLSLGAPVTTAFALMETGGQNILCDLLGYSLGAVEGSFQCQEAYNGSTPKFAQIAFVKKDALGTPQVEYRDTYTQSAFPQGIGWCDGFKYVEWIECRQ